MKEKRIPLRKCVGCGQMKPKAELIRVVRDNAGGVSLDPSGKKPGRGAYICLQGDCLTQARKARRLEKAFSVSFVFTCSAAKEDLPPFLAKYLD